MATPSGNSPSSPASTQGSGRKKQRNQEDNPQTYKEYLQLKDGFLNCHARICDICRSVIYGSREEAHLDYAYDSNLNSFTETQVGDMILGHLDAIYNKVVKDLSSNYGYSEADASTAVLATGIVYGCKDPIGNALHHALTFLQCGLRVDNPEGQNFSEELKTLTKFVSMIEYDCRKKKHPHLCLDDFLIWLLNNRTDPSDESTLTSCQFATLGSHKVSSSYTGLQWKEESTSSSSTVQFMPVAGVTEDDKLDASFPCSENVSEPELNPATGNPGLASGRFTASISRGLPNSNPNAAQNNLSAASFDSLIGKLASLTLSESSILEEKPVCANSKHADSSWRGFTHRQLQLYLNNLQLQLQYWENWAHDKVLQATNRLNKDKAELRTLRQENLEAKKEREAFADSTMKKIREMDKALLGARALVEGASLAIRKFDFEKIRLEEALEAAKLRASESATKFQEASSKEIMTLKKAQTFERERTLLQEELVREKRVLSQVQKQLEQAQVSHDQVEVITSGFIVCFFVFRKCFRVYDYLCFC